MTSHAERYTQEQTFKQTLPSIQQFWQQGQFSSFQGVDDIRINYAIFSQAKNHQCLVIVPGRTEGYLKYQELAYDLVNQGFNLFIIDHRGQGVSQRMLSNPHKGYVASFDDYVNDLDNFVENIVKPHCSANTKPYLLAHSMGGNISALYLAKHSNSIQAAVLASPMIGINTGGLPMWLGKALINTRVWWDKHFNQESSYFIGQGDYDEYPFEDNVLTHSKVRFDYFKQTYDQTAELQLGGVTNAWLQQSLIARQNIFASLDQITTPITVLQSGGDSVVDNLDQFSFCQQLHQQQPQSCPNGEPQVFENAYHELFFEVDEIRNPAIDATLAWFEQHAQ
ncbi:alpha/beta fold hydrolase [Thalassotalea sp. LPB0316]|nr:alpha/beta fold hydrolase [Thalassotalea sp. LPB0316]